MKQLKAKLFLIAVYVTSQSLLQAAMPVIDYRAIYTELVSSRRDLVQQVNQVQNQREQILQLTSQIQQVDDYLDRFGDPGKIDLDSLHDLFQLVRKLPASKSTKELEQLLSEDVLFIEQDIYDDISRGIRVDGQVVTERDVSSYTPDLAARQGFWEFHQLQEEALKKREQIDRDLEEALRQLERASTASEVQKLQVTIATLNAQRAAISGEMELAATTATARHLQNETEASIARKAREEDQRETLKVGLRKSRDLYLFPTGPTLFKP